MTRAMIHEKYRIVRLEPPEIANRSLSDEEAEAYENAVKRMMENFEVLWNEDYSGDID